MELKKLMEHISIIPDYRQAWKVEHKLSDILLLTICAVISSEKSHGREEIRLHIVCDVPDELIDFTFEWKGLKKLCVAVSFRSIIAEQKKEPEMTVRYYISSADLTAEKFATAIRNHWHVENKLHWRLDVVMNEDDCKIRRGNAAELFSGIRHIAINILTNDKVFKAGLRRKMRKAAMDRNYLAAVLAGCGLS
ncbi:ISAs1 family transposase [Escherichia coli]|nr:ISAs1 family transposase [Escherichia coli]